MLLNDINLFFDYHLDRFFFYDKLLLLDLTYLSNTEQRFVAIIRIDETMCSNTWYILLEPRLHF